jgi:hypothetical protein
MSTRKECKKLDKPGERDAPVDPLEVLLFIGGQQFVSWVGSPLLPRKSK